MRRHIAVLCFIALMLAVAPAYAFFDSGEIAPGISFDDLKVSNNGWVKGVIENDTDEYICLSASVLFIDIFDKVLADAFVACIDVLPGGEAVFDTVLLNGSAGNARKAHEVVWIIKGL